MALADMFTVPLSGGGSYGGDVRMPKVGGSGQPYTVEQATAAQQPDWSKTPGVLTVAQAQPPQSSYGLGTLYADPSGGFPTPTPPKAPAYEPMDHQRALLAFGLGGPAQVY